MYGRINENACIKFSRMGEIHAGEYLLISYFTFILPYFIYSNIMILVVQGEDVTESVKRRESRIQIGNNPPGRGCRGFAR